MSFLQCLVFSNFTSIYSWVKALLGKHLSQIAMSNYHVKRGITQNNFVNIRSSEVDIQIKAFSHSKSGSIFHGK